MKRTNKKRRRECKTDYKHRKQMLEGNSPRVILRKTNQYIVGQYVLSKEAQDFVKISISSKELLRNGWPKKWAGSLKSLPAAYLTGMLLGKKIGKIKNNEKKPVLDIGLNRNIAKSRIYAFLKGVMDSGIDIPCNKKMFPDNSRIEGAHMKKDIKSILQKILDKINKEIK